MIKNSNIVITGTSSGIGKELTLKFLENGNKVWGCSRKKDTIAIKNYFHYKVDLSDPSKIEEWVYKVSEDTDGKIDIFVNNAGIAGMNTTVAEYPLDEWKKVMNLNLNSVFYCCKAVVPFMLKNDYGR